MRQAPDTGLIGGNFHLRCQHVAHSADRRKKCLAGDFFCRRSRCRDLLGGETLCVPGAFRQGGHQDVVAWLGRQKTVYPVQCRLQDELRRNHTLGGACFRFRYPLIEDGRDLRQAFQVVVDVTGVAHRVRLAQKVDQADMQSAELLEHVSAVFDSRHANRVLKLPFDRSG